MTAGEYGCLSVPTRTGMDAFSYACCKSHRNTISTTFMGRILL